MTATSHFLARTRGAATRRAAAFARIGYYFSYISAGAEKD